MGETVTLTTDARGVATLTLNRPDKHNAMSGDMIAELTRAAEALGADDAVRVVVLSAAGPSFCAGGDLRWMQAQMAADRATRAAEAQKLSDMLAALYHLPKPLIGAVQGNAFGGGVGLAAVCDVTLAAETARFGLTETRLGLIPATIGPFVLARLGAARARDVFMSARIFDADDALRLGLLSRVVAPGALPAAVEAEVTPYLACAPGAVADAKRYAIGLGPPIDAALRARSVAALVARWETEEAQAGIGAFFDKRPAPWEE